MKLITFAVPSYNSEAYLHKCVDSLLTGGDEVEIIIVNDGSKDATRQIADDYAAKYPTIVKPVHKENGGHGSGVNAGIKHATGLYYKVVDSDDWVDEGALKTLLDTVRAHVEAGESADIYFTNFVYEHVEDNTSHTRRYVKYFPTDRFFSWKDVKKFKTSHVILMHAIMYRTEALRESNTVLPEHTFYVDNLFAYQPLPYMKKLYYLDIDFYRYFIGRIDQSVNINNFTKRYDQQIRVMTCMMDAHSLDSINKLDKGLKKYMIHCLGSIMMNTLLFTVLGDDKKVRKAAVKNMWKHFKTNDKKLYRKIRYCSYPFITNLMPWGIKRVAMLAGYNFLCKTQKLG